MCVGLCEYMLYVCGLPPNTEENIVCEVGLQAVVSHLIWVLGKDTWSLARTATLLTAELSLHPHIVIVIIKMFRISHSLFHLFIHLLQCIFIDMCWGIVF